MRRGCWKPVRVHIPGIAGSIPVGASKTAIFHLAPGVIFYLSRLLKKETHGRSTKK